MSVRAWFAMCVVVWGLGRAGRDGRDRSDFVVGALMACQQRVYGDTTMCAECGGVWDTGDIPQHDCMRLVKLREQMELDYRRMSIDLFFAVAFGALVMAIAMVWWLK